jgi:prepilin-type N-terminal cleavage/methylation domain-containing protein
VKESDAKFTRASHAPERGYSLIEFVVVAVIIGVISAIAILQLMPTWQGSQADAAMSQVESALRQAREEAISQRRTIEVDFDSAAAGTVCPAGGSIYDCIELYLYNVSGTPAAAVKAANPFLVLPIEGNVEFMTITGEPSLPSPDNSFGVPSPPSGLIFTGAVGNMAFQSDGTFTDSTGTQINGAVFLMEPNKSFTERAVTILGATGKVRKWHGTGTGWFQSW